MTDPLVPITALVGLLAVTTAAIGLWSSRSIRDVHRRLPLGVVAATLGVMGLLAVATAVRGDALDGPILAVTATMFGVVAVLAG